jgi:TonB-linked SusC/RagA family outer membrane protein
MKLNAISLAMSRSWLPHKFLLVMKLTTLLLIVTFLHCSAEGFSQNVNLNETNTPLTKVLQLINQQTGHVFFYDSKDVLNKTISIHVKDVSLTDALKMSLKGTSLTYKIVNNTIVLQLNDEAAVQLKRPAAVPIPVSGKVTDQNNLPLPGVNVRIKGKKGGAVTDTNGNFKIEVEDNNAVLVFSYVGFVTQELPVTTSMSVVLAADQSKLAEVVVVGYGTQKKLNLTGSVEMIGASQLENRPTQDVSNLLTGLVPGLTVVQNSGQPGRDGGTLRIRGIGTLGNNDPLVIVDGVESTYSNMDPNDIESISILKDASASAIYGVRAANGVLLITTKRGKTGRTVINYSNYFGAQNAIRTPKFLGSADYATLYNEALVNDGGTALYSATEIQKFRDGSDPDHYANSDWVNALFSESGFVQNHSLSMNGGSEKTRYNLSFGYLDRDGLIKNTGSDRYSFRINLDQDVSKRFKVGLNLSAIRQQVTDPSMTVDDLTYRAYRQNPTSTIRYSNGNWGGYPYSDNPVAAAAVGGSGLSTNDRVLGTVNAEYELLKGLKIKGVASITDNKNKTHQFNKSYQLFNDTIPTTTIRSGVSEARTENLETNLQAFLDYTHTFGKDHNFKALLGYNQISDSYDEIYATVLDLPSTNTVDQLSGGDKSTLTNDGYADDYRLRSFFGRLNYNYKEKYLLEANFRYDGTSRFPKNNRYAFFPSFSAGWNLTKEEFFPAVSWIDNIKLRGSWGRLGNQEIGNYAYLPSYALGVNYTFGGNLASGIAENSSLANTNITWETTTETNAGVDADFFKGKLSFTGEYYSRNTSDILLSLPQPSVLGGSPPTVNAGSVSNKGYDLIVRHRNQLGKFGYWVNANFAYVKNKITDLAGGDTPGRSVGDPVNNIYGYVAKGLFQSQQEIDTAPSQVSQFGGTSPGDIRYADISGPNGVPDGKIDTYDRKSLGSNFPAVTYGFQLGASYESFDFSVSAQGVGKVQSYLSQQAIQPFYNSGKVLVDHLDTWTPQNPDATFPRLSLNNASRNYNTNSFFVYNASYLRIRNIQVGYSLPKNVLNKLKVQRLRFYFSVDNPFLFTSYKIYDPEAPQTNGNYYPQVTTITGGLNLTF